MTGAVTRRRRMERRIMYKPFVTVSVGEQYVFTGQTITFRRKSANF